MSKNFTCIIALGRFQPFHKGHLENIKGVVEKYSGLPLYILNMVSKNEKTIFNKETTEEIIDISISSEIPSLDFEVVQESTIAKALVYLHEKYSLYEPFLWIVGPDRKDERLFNYQGSKAVGLDERYLDISSTQIRESLLKNDYSTFKNMMCKEANTEEIFKKLRREMNIMKESYLKETAFPLVDEEDLQKISKESTRRDLKELFKIIKNYSEKEVDYPLSIDDKDSSKIKITRKYQKDSSFHSYLSSQLKISVSSEKIGKWKSLFLKWGEGTRGNRGATNIGASFEKSLFKDIKDLIEEGLEEENFINPILISQIEDTFEIGNLGEESVSVELVGGKNLKRDLIVEPSFMEASIKSSSLAENIADIIINKEGENYYLSLKATSHGIFINTGISNIISKEDIIERKIRGEGLLLLNNLNIEPMKFCEVFNSIETGKRNLKISLETGISNKRVLEHLISSIIGKGYYLVNKEEELLIEVNSIYNKKASILLYDPIIYYGGKKGGTKNIIIQMESSLYYYDLYFRNNEGGTYPNIFSLNFRHK